MKTVKVQVELFDGRMEPKVTSKLEVGEWFRIDRDVIEKNRKKSVAYAMRQEI